MPAIGNISVNDATSPTPVAHLFTPVTTDGQVGKFANRAGGVPVGYELLSLEMRAPQSATGAYRLLAKLAFPVTAVVDGTTQVVRTSSAEVTLNFAQASTDVERKNYLKIVSNLLAHATVVAMAEFNEPIY